MTSGKGDDVIGEVLGGVESAECLTGTLRIKSEKNYELFDSGVFSVC